MLHSRRGKLYDKYNFISAVACKAMDTSTVDALYKMFIILSNVNEIKFKEYILDN